MINVSKGNSIRQMRREAKSIAAIAQANSVSRDTFYKYLKKQDSCPVMPTDSNPRPLKLDPYKSIIE